MSVDSRYRSHLKFAVVSTRVLHRYRRSNDMEAVDRYTGFQLLRQSAVRTCCGSSAGRKLTQTQLQNKNPSEKIVDKDNHLRLPEVPGACLAGLDAEMQRRIQRRGPAAGGGKGHYFGGHSGGAAV